MHVIVTEKSRPVKNSKNKGTKMKRCAVTMEPKEDKKDKELDVGLVLTCTIAQRTIYWYTAVKHYKKERVMYDLRSSHIVLIERW